MSKKKIETKKKGTGKSSGKSSKTHTSKKHVSGVYTGDVAPEHCFWCTDGQVIASLSALPKALENMNASSFKYHVNRAKNDFAAWVNDVICDHHLAKQLQKAGNKTKVLKLVKKRLKSVGR